jgi:sn-glycerol 3-phosphate transport system substrate-binding protein
MQQKMMMKRPIALGLAALTALGLLAGCASTGSGKNADAPKKIELKEGEKVKVTFWHAMGGNLGKAVDALVEAYNKSQTKVQVEAVYQGTYDEALQKLKAAGPNGPTMIQVYEIGSRFMIDSGLVTPMQQFIDADKWENHLEPNIAAYYTFDGKLNSLPFNTSTPIVYYNKDAFKKAGLDPEKFPTTFKAFSETAQKLTVKNGAETTQYGAGIAIYGWFFEQLTATHGAYLVDNENGRKAKATKSLADQKEGQDILNWLNEMVKEGSAINLGRKTADTQAAFTAGKIAITMDSTAALAGILSASKFEVGTAFIPRAAGNEKAGVIIGGASVWITNLKPAKEQWAAWEFAKWLSTPETQAKWHEMTGYFPVNKKAYDLPSVKELHAKRPQFKTAIEQLRASQISPVTQGAVMGVFPQARQIIEGAMENVLTGKKSTPDALKEAAAEITKQIESYNKTTK